MLDRKHCTYRRNALRERAARRGWDQAVISRSCHVYYLTGLLNPDPRTPSLLLVNMDGTDRLLVPQAQEMVAKACFGGEVITYEDYSIEQIVFPLERMREALFDLLAEGMEGVCVGIEAPYLSTDLRDAVVEAGGTKGMLADISPEIRSLRACKDTDELSMIREAERLADAGYAAAIEAVQPGRTEVEVYADMQRAVVLVAGKPTPFAGDFLSGERTLQIGGGPTDRVLKAGDPFIFDLFPTYQGYWADTCRTFIVGGAPTAEQRKTYDVLRRALEVGEQRLRVGVKANEIYRTVYEAIAAEGLGKHFPHHAGHGIGLEAPEAPFLIPGSDEVLEEGMIVTLEPGVYIPDFGGMRLEDNYLITGSGPEKLSFFPREWD